MNYKANLKFRHELKYLINYGDYYAIKMRIENLLYKDVNVNPEGLYTVRSLYFDDYFNSAYNEKYMGIKNRQKLRIRVYNYSDEAIRLERKIKDNQYIYKESTFLQKSEVESIINGDYSFLIKGKDQIKNLFYYECVTHMARPRVIVDYEREPFVFEAGNVRITFDTDIRANVDQFDLFNQNIAMLNILEPEYLVMEVKFTEFLPSIIRQVLPSEATNFLAISKYVLSCDKTLHYQRSDY